MVECPRRAPVGLPSHVGTSYPSGARHCFEQSVQTHPPIPLPVPSSRVVERGGRANGLRTRRSSGRGGYGTKPPCHYPRLDTIHTPCHKPPAGQRRGYGPKKSVSWEQTAVNFVSVLRQGRSNLAPQSCPKVRARGTPPCNPLSVPICKRRRFKKFEWLFLCVHSSSKCQQIARAWHEMRNFTPSLNRRVFSRTIAVSRSERVEWRFASPSPVHCVKAQGREVPACFR